MALVQRAYNRGLELPGIQPRGKMQIDWSHPITRGLSYFRRLDQGAGSAPDFIDNGSDGNLATSSAAKIGLAQGGVGLTGSNLLTSTTPTYIVPQIAGTFVGYSTVSWGPTDGVYRSLVDLGSTAFSVIKYLDNNWYVGFNSGARATVAASGIFNAGDTFSTAVTWSTAGGTTLYTKGQSRVNNPSDPNPISTMGTFSIGGSSGADSNLWNDNSGDAIYYVAFWSRVLSASEIAILNSDPYCFLMPAEGEMPSLFLPSAGGFLAAWARNSNLPVIGTGNY